jgi:6-pyruvoyl-tetrahydropterin synthase
MTVSSFNMQLNDEIIDCFTEKKETEKKEKETENIVLDTKDIKPFKSESMESYHKEDIIKINQQKLITHVNTQSVIIDYYRTKFKTSK